MRAAANVRSVSFSVARVTVRESYRQLRLWLFA